VSNNVTSNKNDTGNKKDLTTRVVGYAEISKAAKVALLTVKRTIRKLKEADLLALKEQFNTADRKGSVYQVILPDKQSNQFFENLSFEKG